MSNVQMGREHLFAYAKETAYNEPWGSPTLVAIPTGVPDFEPSVDTLKAKHVNASPELNWSEIGLGVRSWTLKIGGKLPKEGMGIPLLNVFGKVVTTGAGVPYTHTFTPSLRTPPSLKCLVRTPFRAAAPTLCQWHLRGGMIRLAEFIYKNNDFPRFNLELIGGSFSKEALTTAPTLLVPTPPENPYWQAQEYTTGRPYVKQSLTSYTGWTTFTIRFENQLAADLDESYEIGSDERIRLERAASEEAFSVILTAKRVVLEDSEDLEGFFEDKSQTGFRNTLEIPTDRILDITSPGGIIRKYKRTPRGHGLVEEDIELLGMKDSAGNSMTIILKDDNPLPATEGT